MKAQRTSPSDWARIWSHELHKGLQLRPGKSDLLGSIHWHPIAPVRHVQAQRHRRRGQGRPVYFILHTPHRALAAISTWTRCGSMCAAETSERRIHCNARPARSTPRRSLPQVSRSYGLPRASPQASTRSLWMPATCALHRPIYHPLYVEVPYVKLHLLPRQRLIADHRPACAGCRRPQGMHEVLENTDLARVAPRA